MAGQRSPTTIPAMLPGRGVASVPRGFGPLDALEGRLCVACNSCARNVFVRRFFVAVSRLGDGAAWVAMLSVLPLVFGATAWAPTLAMAVTAWAAIVLNRLLKSGVVRRRPYASHPEVEPVTEPLDRNSFPSGHTLHAAAFAVQLGEYFPEALWLVLPFALSVAASRVVLGLHYPSDVAAGAVLGWVLAQLSLAAASGLGL